MILRPGNAGATTPPTTSRCSSSRSSNPRQWRARRALGLGRRQPRAGRGVPRDGDALSLGHAIDERVRSTILALPERAWRPAINADGQPGEVLDAGALDHISPLQIRGEIPSRERPPPPARRRPGGRTDSTARLSRSRQSSPSRDLERAPQPPDETPGPPLGRQPPRATAIAMRQKRHSAQLRATRFVASRLYECGSSPFCQDPSHGDPVGIRMPVAVGTAAAAILTTAAMAGMALIAWL